MLRQAFAHCAKFPTAASRRSLGRVSVPVWVIVLSDHLPIVALVSRYPTNELIGRRPLPKRLAALMTRLNVSPHAVLATLSGSYSPPTGTSPTRYSAVCHCAPKDTVRLACFRHAASVYPEPGSNSPRKLNLAIELNLKSLVQARSCADCSYHSSVVKVQRPAFTAQSADCS